MCQMCFIVSSVIFWNADHPSPRQIDRKMNLVPCKMNCAQHPSDLLSWSFYFHVQLLFAAVCLIWTKNQKKTTTWAHSIWTYFESHVPSVSSFSILAAILDPIQRSPTAPHFWPRDIRQSMYMGTWGRVEFVAGFKPNPEPSTKWTTLSFGLQNYPWKKVNFVLFLDIRINGKGRSTGIAH